ncbi:hypothetical protein JTE90_017521 [Oedothorax gibbosus]|uniref:DUF3752 domain-containing protein n=1 Tax=Oedothorax gibbosus TaxID=931172 RepID=A0AAV6UBB8_9ARAC|nr:hypothetical protein JTE90_017521 [Oedothorax gibbosus]
MEDLYGPPLPPGYVRPNDSNSEESDAEMSDEPEEHSPKIIGPQVPDFLSRKELDELDTSIPAKTASEEPANVIGPVLPASLRRRADSSDDEAVGPVPSMCSNVESDINETRAAIEKRAENMKNKLDNKYIPTVDVVEREEWMTVPDDRKNQLGAITRSLVPESKSSSSKEKHSHHRRSEKDKKTSEELKKYNKSKRSESLLELHKKDKKKKEKDKQAKKERKAFDRDEIVVKQFTKDQVNSVVDKAKYLNSRFGRGNEQYL